MFGFGGLSELLFIAFLAMLIFGPEKLPEMGRMLAKALAEVRKASNELKRTLNSELALAEQEQNMKRMQESMPPPVAPERVPPINTLPAPSPEAAVPWVEPPEPPEMAPPTAPDAVPGAAGEAAAAAAAAEAHSPLLAPYGEAGAVPASSSAPGEPPAPAETHVL